jgi:hypothetical protein
MKAPYPERDLTTTMTPFTHAIDPPWSDSCNARHVAIGPNILYFGTLYRSR